MNEYLKQDFRSFKIIYAALIAGVALFIIISMIFNMSVGGIEEFLNPKTSNMFLIAANILAVFAIFAGLYIFNKQTAGFKGMEIGKKLTKFRSAMIIRAAMTEAACFLFIVGYLLSNSNIFLIEAIFCIAVLIYFFPTDDRLLKEMKIDKHKFI